MLITSTDMALPIIKSLADCADFSKTVTPYIPQLYNLPQQLLNSYSNPAELRSIYLATNPLISGFAFSLALAPIVLIISEFNRNYSQIDRLWSILPTLYNAHFCLYAHMSGLPTARLDNLIAFSVIWSLRLTYNYWRKGGYSIGSEDYRWEKLRDNIPPPLFFVFNVLFISLAQSVLLFLIAAPSYIILLAEQYRAEPTLADSIFPRVLLGLVLWEYFSDQQQWAFQEAKKSYQKTAKLPAHFSQRDLERGFVVTGLWGICRHPNFAAEQAIWVGLYQWSCFVTDSFYNWTGLGAASYLILFQASTWFTELISAKKYPEYKDYQKHINKFLPSFTANWPLEDVVKEPVVKVEKKPKEERAAKHPAVRLR